MNIPEGLKYTKDHEWIKVDGNVGTIGITDYAQGELGDIVYIDIENDQDEVSEGDSIGTIEAVKTVADMNAPVSGKVIEVNEGLNDAPETVNSDPYGDGWIVKMELSDPAEVEKLMDAETYKGTID
jgi:glycine cleavage system H protein